MRSRFDTRWAIGAPGLAPPEDPGRPAEVGGWIRLADGTPVDHHVLAMLSDAWAPAVFGRLPVHAGVPTVDLTVHFRDQPSGVDGWCLVRFRTRTLARGYLEEDGEIWSADGRLLAQSRQLGVLLEAPD